MLEQLEKSAVRPRPFPKSAVSQFRAFRNRVAHEPHQISVALLRNTIKLMGNPEFGRTFVKAGRVARERVQYLCRQYKHRLNRAFAHARNAWWLVDIGLADLSPSSETADPWHVFIVLEETLSEHFPNIAFWLAPIFGSDVKGNQGRRWKPTRELPTQVHVQDLPARREQSVYQPARQGRQEVRPT